MDFFLKNKLLVQFLVGRCRLTVKYREISEQEVLHSKNEIEKTTAQLSVNYLAAKRSWLLKRSGPHEVPLKKSTFRKRTVNYFPIQKFAKIFPKSSSLVTCPVIKPN